MQSARSSSRRPAVARWLVVANLLALGAAGAAHAGMLSGYSVAPTQERLITAGMSQDEVKQTLGRPAHMARYGNEPGPTWSYDVNTVTVGGADQTLFDVDFGADGRVVSAQERVVETD